MKKLELKISLFSLVLAVIGILLFDFKQTIDFLSSFLGVDLKNLSYARAWMEMSFRINVFLIAILTVILIEAIVFKQGALWHNSQKPFGSNEIVEYIKNHKEPIEEITIYGYSLSFAEPLRMYLAQEKSNNISINIIVAEEKLIRDLCVENKDISIRISSLKGRLQEWELIHEQGHIKNINIYRHNMIPQEYGIIVNNDIIFASIYRWTLDLGKYRLQKMLLPERGMTKIEDKSSLFFKYIYQINSLRKRNN